MKSLWNTTEADLCQNELDLRVYSSRLLGSDPSLVLHGGGNTSVKIYETNLFGESGSRGSLTPSPHNTLHAAPHRAFHLEW
ncbi:MAG: hypothetical protein KZQ78_14560 [Candidatus Thiodiazotropha sp. (ex Ustalcina ferruginea)]|nr:hypothetical protein [Candidatus Thiodiazotropha sp. (ex Ustalcina ferruginea)]